MINLEQFEIHPCLSPATSGDFSSDSLPSPSESLGEDHQQISKEIDEMDIDEIHDNYSSIEHSANFLDMMVAENPLKFEEGKQLLFNTSGQNSSEQRRMRQEANKLKNQTKNIPKNFGKGIITFIERGDSKIKLLAKRLGLNFPELLEKLKSDKRSINTIADLRDFWIDQKYGKFMRIASNLFFRKNALHYIFNSRICNYGSHIKYRKGLWEAVKDPESFNRIKQY